MPTHTTPTQDNLAAAFADGADARGGGSVTQSLDRALVLLDIVVKHARAGIALGEAAQHAGLKRPTAHRLLTGLRNAGVIDYDVKARLFSPSFRFYQMGLAAGARFDILRIALPSLERLAQETSDTVHLSTRNGDHSICVARRIGDFPIRTLTLKVGDFRPLGLGAGSLALLAALDDEECKASIARNRGDLEANPNYCPDALWQQVLQTRHQGYALNDGLMLPEMAGLAVVIREPGSQVCGALSIAAIRSRMQPPRREEVLALMQAEARNIEQRLRDELARP
ncbi:IclR family transcriptional regulator [Bordetella sp. BOR01]|uniref:IclR family transcriptional regulator n=1 Tax=Bordetella sp. BOR01 TaxID=2854779 RepID=UPI001C45A016|nr:IclR family transcriptional regulator [Bordetella sp. BOR01]MBV7485328.1 IclR family transcriptional regulator [Bordetella sp. BOR01]